MVWGQSTENSPCALFSPLFLAGLLFPLLGFLFPPTGLRLFEGPDQVDHHAPHLKVVLLSDLEDGVGVVGRAQFDISLAPVGEVEIFHRKLPVPEGDDDRSIVWLHGPVYDHAVAVEDARVLHRVALHVAIERRLGVADVVLVEVQRVVAIVVRRRRKSRHDGRVLQFELRVEQSLSDLDVAHAFCVVAGALGARPSFYSTALAAMALAFAVALSSAACAFLRAVSLLACATLS